jgi:hypothetical protein
MDLEEVIRVLVSLGVEPAAARTQLSVATSAAERLEEAAILAVDSDAALLISDDMPLPVALFELVDGLRQSGLPLSIAKNSQEQLVLAFGGTRPCAYELSFEPGASARDLVRAVAYVLPRTHQLLLAVEYEQPGVLPILVLDRGTFVWFSAAVGDGALERVFVRAGSETGLVKLQVCESSLARPDWQARYAWHAPQLEAASEVDSVFERVSLYDPRVAWPADRKRPPGDDFYELCNALSATPLAACLRAGSDAELAQLLYRFALVTLVGAHCDILAARRNPGLSAQGLLGWGQLTWAYFIFDALGAAADAERVGTLLDEPWVKMQERGLVAARQRAYYDLARWMRSGVAGASLPRLAELLPLRERLSWEEPELVSAALTVHTEPTGDQLTHHALYHVWPAPLYALARRASAIELLPKDNPFLSRPVLYTDVVQSDPMIVRLREQLAGFDALDPERLPALLDPLPVVVDVAVTRIEGDDVYGHTLLRAFDDAEHCVIAPRGGRSILPGEVWLLEIQGSKRSTAEQHFADLGHVRCTIALPTGEWLERR